MISKIILYSIIKQPCILKKTIKNLEWENTKLRLKAFPNRRTYMLTICHHKVSIVFIFTPVRLLHPNIHDFNHRGMEYATCLLGYSCSCRHRKWWVPTHFKICNQFPPSLHWCLLLLGSIWSFNIHINQKQQSCRHLILTSLVKG